MRGRMQTGDIMDAFAFDNSYARLPDRFYSRLAPTPVQEPRLIRLNRTLAAELGLDVTALEGPEAVQAFAGNRVPATAEPLAMAYAGHQFGGWVPQLGDGRALLLGEVIDGAGRRRDIQLKGSGPTPYSRMGDGRAPLGPVLREYIVSEAMAALGVPTTRALAAVASGQPVMREAILPGGVLTRVAASHIRVGTFQFFASREDEEGLRLLADHAIERHDPEAARAADPYAALLDGVVARQAKLVARWMSLGFIHGVMNTDNMTISGETIDYGPCAFMDAYHPETVFSSIDQFGRYAYGNQPKIAQWNLACLAQSLLPLLPGDDEARISRAQASIDAYPEIFQTAWLGEMRAKIGIQPAEGDVDLIQALLTEMANQKADFTRVFRGLADGTARDEFADPSGFDAWAADWKAHAPDLSGLDRVNPIYIPRNHLVEEALSAAQNEDFAPFETLLQVLAKPFEVQADRDRYAHPAPPQQAVHRTFCGT